MGADYLAEKCLTSRLETLIISMYWYLPLSIFPHALPEHEGLFFLTTVLTTSHDEKVVKTANLGIAKNMCDNSRLSNYKAYASAE